MRIGGCIGGVGEQPYLVPVLARRLEEGDSAKRAS